MKFIHKDHRQEPQSLRNFRETTPNARYDGLHGDIKQDIREALAGEQGFLCAYCMGRIRSARDCMEVEHFIPQNRHPASPFSENTHRENELRYQNMLGTCQGVRSCSGIRGNRPIVVDPHNEDCERLVRFKKDGSVYSYDERVKDDIRVLELDMLSDQRKVVIDKARDEMIRLGAWTNQRLDNEILRWKTPKQTRHGLALEPYCMAAVHYLESKKS